MCSPADQCPQPQFDHRLTSGGSSNTPYRSPSDVRQHPSRADGGPHAKRHTPGCLVALWTDDRGDDGVGHLARRGCAGLSRSTPLRARSSAPRVMYRSRAFRGRRGTAVRSRVGRRSGPCVLAGPSASARLPRFELPAHGTASPAMRWRVETVSDECCRRDPHGRAVRTRRAAATSRPSCC